MNILAPCFAAFTPTPAVRSIDWFRDHIFTHEDTGGRPYDHGQYPHLGAPGGPCDALDDKRVRLIALQWGSRCGKSFFAQCAALHHAQNQPCPMMLAGPDEKIAKEVTMRTYGMMANTRCLRSHLRKPRFRRQDRIDFKRCKMYVAWARSVSTLADKAVRFGHANEIDKWEHLSTSKEADPLKLFMDRGKEFPTRKFVLESTPTIKGRSRIEHARLQSTNCSYHVPCPHCKRYQTLVMGSPESKNGIKWDRNEAGKHDKDLARKTARYVCLHCEADIHDEHRAWMIRRGVWVPEGCRVNDDGANAMFDSGGSPPWRGWSLAEWIEGEPVRDGSDAGYQLSSLYALSLGWGDIAAEFVGSKDKPQNLRNFVNQWLGETWELIERQMSWEQLGTRIITHVPRFVVPDGYSLVTAGVDKQDSHFPFVVTAWAPGGKSHTLHYGAVATPEELLQSLTRTYAHADGGTPLHVALTLIDSGFRPRGVAEMCRRFPGRGKMLPCKGSSVSMNVPFRVSIQDAKSAMPGMQLVLVDTTQSQDWIEDVLRGGDTKTVFEAGLFEHEDYLSQLLNDAPIAALDSRNNDKITWDRIKETIPNDWRDTERYAWAAMMLATGGVIPGRGKAAPRPVEDSEQRSRFQRLDLKRR